MRIERALLEALAGRGKTIAIAESCTGGLMSSRLTGVPGASAVLISAVVPYANDAKTELAGVPPTLLGVHGAVSAETAAALAEGIRSRTGADIGLSTTCIAGPGGATGEKPVGLSFLAVADADGVDVRRLELCGSRTWVREQLTEEAFGASLERLGAERPAPSGVSLVVVADEVLAGHTEDTNSGEIAAEVFGAGASISKMFTVPDRIDDIVEAMSLAARDTNLVLVCGGLGPTPDDRTGAALAEFLGKPFVEDPGALAMVERRLGEGKALGVIRDPAMNDGRRKMAMIPKGSEHLENDVGYGPGCLARTAGRTIVLMPGVPSEMRHMLGRHVLPLLDEYAIPRLHVKEIFMEGSESVAAPVMARLESEFPEVSIGSYPNLESYGTTIRFTGPEADVSEAASRFQEEMDHF